tara:strand:+ start:1014 stop:1790 length:777 start_codon:yes stop_codon:yes gene_type:complete
MAAPSSVTKTGKNEPFELQVARGLISWHTPVNIFGYQEDVTTALNAVWDVAAVYVYPTEAIQMRVYSSSDSDVAVPITVVGLDANFVRISENLTLTNGTTGVLTTKLFYRINTLVVSNGVDPVGTITLSTSDKTVTYAQINLDTVGGVLRSAGRSQMSIYSVPAGHTFYLYRVDAYSSQGGSGNAYANYRVQSDNNVTGQRFEVLRAPFSNNYNARRSIPFPYTEKTDIQWQASVQTGTGPIGIIVEGILIKNDASVS